MKPEIFTSHGIEVLKVPAASSDPHVVFFHGYGADNWDLFPLHTEISFPRKVNWYFPNAPTQVPIGPGMMGRAWFPINMAEVEEAMQNGTYRNFRNKRLSEYKKTVEQAQAFVSELTDNYSSLYLGGFSQGAMMATELTLTAPQQTGGLIILSGTFLDEERWKSLMAPPRAQWFFASHGQQDPLLDPQEAERLSTELLQSGWTGEFHSFRGGHEIPRTILERLNQWLKNNTG